MLKSTSNLNVVPLYMGSSSSFVPEGVTEFIQRNSNVSLGNAIDTRLARATAFNIPAVEFYFTQYNETVEKYKLGFELIYNVDKRGLSTVHNPLNLLLSKLVKRWGVQHLETRVTVTTTGFINAVGISISPV
jgi:hypothetical protein